MGTVRPVDFSCLAILAATAGATAAATAGSRERPWPSAAAVAAPVSVIVVAPRAGGWAAAPSLNDELEGRAGAAGAA